MSDKMFDSFIQNKMRDHASPVPGDMWDRIMKEQDRRDKVFGYRKWYAIAALLLLMVGAGATYLYFTNINSTDTVTTEQLPAGNDHSTKGSDDNNDKNTNTNTITITTENNNNNSNSTSTLNNDPSNKTSTDPTSNNAISPINNSSKANSNLTRNTIPSSLVNTLTTGITETNNATITAQENVQQGSTLESKYIPYSLGELARMERSSYSKSLGTKLSELNKKLMPVIDCPTVKEARNSDLYAEIFLSPDYNQRKINSSNSSFVSSKDSSEKIQASFTAGIRLAKPLSKNLLLKTGIQYSQINEKRQVRIENERRTVTVITTRTIQTSPGVFTTISDTSVVEQIGYVTQTTQNKYKNIDVPLLLSYEFGNENLKFAVTGGAIMNISSSVKGKTIDTSGATIQFDKSNNLYKTNMGVGIYAAASVIKPVGERLDVFAEPYVRYNLSNMTKNTAGFTQKFSSAGVNIGIRYNLGKQR